MSSQCDHDTFGRCIERLAKLWEYHFVPDDPVSLTALNAHVGYCPFHAYQEQQLDILIEMQDRFLIKVSMISNGVKCQGPGLSNDGKVRTAIASAIDHDGVKVSPMAQRIPKPPIQCFINIPWNRLYISGDELNSIAFE